MLIYNVNVNINTWFGYICITVIGLLYISYKNIIEPWDIEYQITGKFFIVKLVRDVWFHHYPNSKKNCHFLKVIVVQLFQLSLSETITKRTIRTSLSNQPRFHKNQNHKPTVVNPCDENLRRRAHSLGTSNGYSLLDDLHAGLLNEARNCAPIRIHFTPSLVSRVRNGSCRKNAFFLIFVIRVVNLVVNRLSRCQISFDFLKWKKNTPAIRLSSLLWSQHRQILRFE